MSEERYSGPSKEQLEIYFKTSRAYFDELAKEYEKKHPEYYKKYFAPFYTFRFGSSKTSGPKGSGAGFLIVISAMILLIGIGAAVFFLVMQNASVEQPEVKTVEQPADKKETFKNTEPAKKRAAVDTADAKKEEVVPDNLDKPLKESSDDESGRRLRRKPYRIYR